MEKANITVEKCKIHGCEVTSFHAQGGQGWCIVGANGSGIDAFADLVGDQKSDGTWAIKKRKGTVGYISFFSQQRLYEEELRNDDTDFMNKLDPGRLAKDFIQDWEQHTELIVACNMAEAMDTGYKQLSSGQSRKLCLLSELSKGVDCLVMQNPYEGIDRQTRAEFDKLFSLLLSQGKLIIITVNTLEDVPAWATHCGLIQNATLRLQGKIAQVLPDIAKQLQAERLFTATTKDIFNNRETDPVHTQAVPLVELRHGFASYGGKTIFQDINLTIHRLEHTLITGPNGCGKSTLIQLITGDHPMCYQNNLHIFGRKRGTGESIWDIKKDMGIVSSELHRNHRIPGSALQVIISGLFDSIGMYRHPTREQLSMAHFWLNKVGMTDHVRTPFRQLSYGEQRLLLIGRALIKSPRLLVLDEPTLGLDHANRMAILNFLEQAAAEKLCTVIYVSHREDEYRSFFQQHLQLAAISA
ncbi:ATP-binding cassette domain-containing protein [Desulfogranum japonicum]|uniref:ATP-binding cassette domain-containing protein n=1 Tax=Desulfogranum japonicum TaxID=231447 RepID=UPI000424BABA|nr:ATP-binding cassette domain-containing protein [Desulfogranum japonicum]